jgi:hypothetical protein
VRADQASHQGLKCEWGNSAVDTGDSAKKERQDSASGKPEETQLEPAGEVVVTHHKAPPKGPPNKEIHPRRRLPPVPEGPPRETERDPTESEQRED